MAHPFADIRENKVERSRVSRIIKDYDGGDGIRKAPRTMSPDGDFARPRRASGGAVKKAGVTVNVITQAPQPPRPERHIAGALYVSCSGRGGPHFGGPGAELQIVRRALGDVPLVGFFAGGEIARHHLYGYTGVLTVFTTDE